MKSIHIKGLAVVFAGLAAVSTAQAQSATRTSSAPSGAAGSTTNVNVVNTPTVNVGNTPTVNVGIMPTVTVGNAVTVKEDRQPLHFSRSWMATAMHWRRAITCPPDSVPSSRASRSVAI